MVFGLFVLVLFLAAISLKQIITLYKRRFISMNLSFIESNYNMYFVSSHIQNYAVILKSGQELKDLPNSKVEKYGIRCGLIRSIVCNLEVDAKEIESIEDALIIKSYFDDNLRKSKSVLIFSNPILLEMDRNTRQSWYN